MVSGLILCPLRCIKYLGELLDLLIAHPEVVLNVAVRDDDENFTVSSEYYQRNVCVFTVCLGPKPSIHVEG